MEKHPKEIFKDVGNFSFQEFQFVESFIKTDLQEWRHPLGSKSFNHLHYFQFLMCNTFCTVLMFVTSYCCLRQHFSYSKSISFDYRTYNKKCSKLIVALGWLQWQSPLHWHQIKILADEKQPVTTLKSRPVGNVLNCSDGLKTFKFWDKSVFWIAVVYSHNNIKHSCIR